MARSITSHGGLDDLPPDPFAAPGGTTTTLPDPQPGPLPTDGPRPRRPGAGRRGGRIQGLDGLRALAVIAVLLYHAEVPWARGGFLGVDVFFVLSGYLVTSLVLRATEGDGHLDLRSFWSGRFRRLAPALLTLLVTTVLAVRLLHPDEVAGLRGQVLSTLTGTTNWYLIVADSSYFDQLGRPPYLRHLWSIAIELQFYLVVPPLVAWALRRHGARLDRIVGVLLGLVVLSGCWMAILFDPGGDPSRAYYDTFARLAAPLLGVVLALVWRRSSLARGPVGRAGPQLTAAGLGALAVLALVVITTDDRASWLYRGGFVLVALLTVVVVAALTHPGSGLGGRRGLGHPLMVAIGVRSYCLYLWHWPIFVLLRPGIDVHWGWGTTFVVRIALTVALTEVCHRYVEARWHRGTLAPSSRAPRGGRPADDAERNRRLAVVGGCALAVALAVAALAFAPPERDEIAESLQAGQAALAASATSTTVAGVPPTTARPTPTTVAPTVPGETAPPPTTAPIPVGGSHHPHGRRLGHARRRSRAGGHLRAGGRRRRGGRPPGRRGGRRRGGAAGGQPLGHHRGGAAGQQRHHHRGGGPGDRRRGRRGPAGLRQRPGPPVVGGAGQRPPGRPGARHP